MSFKLSPSSSSNETIRSQCPFSFRLLKTKEDKLRILYNGAIFTFVSSRCKGRVSYWQCCATKCNVLLTITSATAITNSESSQIISGDQNLQVINVFGSHRQHSICKITKDLFSLDDSVKVEPIYRIGQLVPFDDDQEHNRLNCVRCIEHNSNLDISNVPSTSHSSKQSKPGHSFEHRAEISLLKPTTTKRLPKRLRSKKVNLPPSPADSIEQPNVDSLNSNLNDNNNGGQEDNASINDSLCPNEIVLLKTKKGCNRILYCGSLFNLNYKSRCEQFYNWYCFKCKVLLKTTIDCSRLVSHFTGCHQDHLDNRFPQDLFRYQHSIGQDDDEEPLFRRGDPIPNEVHNRSQCNHCSGLIDQSNSVQEETELNIVEEFNANVSLIVPECSSVCEQFQPKEHSTQSDITLDEAPNSVSESFKVEPIFRIDLLDHLPSTSHSSKQLTSDDSFENSGEISVLKPTTTTTAKSLRKRLLSKMFPVPSSLADSIEQPNVDSLNSNLNDNNNGGQEDNASINDTSCPYEIQLFETEKGFCRILYRGSLFTRNHISRCKQFYYWRCFQCKAILKTALDYRRLVNVSTVSHYGHLNNHFPKDLFRFQHSIGQDDEEPLFRRGDTIPNEIHNRSQCSHCSGLVDQSNSVQEETESIVPESNANVPLNVPECSSVCEQFQPKEHSTQSDITLDEAPNSVSESFKVEPIFRIDQLDHLPSTSHSSKQLSDDSVLKPTTTTTTKSQRKRLRANKFHVPSSQADSIEQPNMDFLNSNLNDDNNNANNGLEDNASINDTLCPYEIQLLENEKGYGRILFRGSLFRQNNKSRCKQFYYWRCSQCKVMLKTTSDCPRLVSVSNGCHQNHLDNRLTQDLFRYQHSIGQDEPIFRLGDTIPNEVHNRSRCSHCSGQSMVVQEETDETVESFSMESYLNIPESNAGVSSIVPESKIGISSIVPESNAGISSIVPESNAGISSIVPESNAGISSIVPESNAGISSNVPESTAGISSNVPESTAGISSNVPESTAGISSMSHSSKLKRDYSFEHSVTKQTTSRPKRLRRSNKAAYHVSIESDVDSSNLMNDNANNASNDGLCPNEFLLLETETGFLRIVYRGSVFNRKQKSKCKQCYYWRCYRCNVLLKITIDCLRLVSVSTGSHSGHSDNRFPRDLYRFQHSIGQDDDEEPLFRRGDPIPNEVHNRSQCSHCSGLIDQSNLVQEETETIVESSTMVSNSIESTTIPESNANGPLIVPECSSVCDQFQSKEHSTQSDITLDEGTFVPESLKRKPIFQIDQFDYLPSTSRSSKQLKRDDLFEHHPAELSVLKPTTTTTKSLRSNREYVPIEPNVDSLSLNLVDSDALQEDNNNNGLCPNEIQILETKNGFYRIVYRGSVFNRKEKRSNHFYYWKCFKCKVLLKTTIDCRRLVAVIGSHQDHSDNWFPRDLFRYQHSIEHNDGEPIFRRGDPIPNEIHSCSRCNHCSGLIDQSNSAQEEETETESNVSVSSIEQFQSKEHSTQLDATLEEAPESVPECSLKVEPILRIDHMDYVPSTSSDKLNPDSFENSVEHSISKSTTIQSKRFSSNKVHHVASSSSSLTSPTNSINESDVEPLNLSHNDNGRDDNTLCSNKIQLLKTKQGFCRILYRGSLFRQKRKTGCKKFSYWYCYKCKVMLKTTIDENRLLSVGDCRCRLGGDSDCRFPKDLYQFQQSIEEDDEPLFRRGDPIPYEAHDCSRCSHCSGSIEQSASAQEETDTELNVDSFQSIAPSTFDEAQPVSTESSLQLFQSIEPSTLDEAPTVLESNVDLSQSIAPSTLNVTPPVSSELNVDSFQSIAPSTLNEAPTVLESNVDLSQSIAPSTLNVTPSCSTESNVDSFQSIAASTLNEAPPVSTKSNVDLFQSIAPSTLDEAQPILTKSNVDSFQSIAPSTLDEAPPVSTESSLQIFQSIAPSTLNEAPPVSTKSNVDSFQSIAPSTLDEAPPVSTESNVDSFQSIEPSTLNVTPPVSTELNVYLPQSIAPSTLDEAPPVSTESNVDSFQSIEPSTLNVTPPVSTELNVYLPQSIAPSTLDEAPTVLESNVDLSQSIAPSTLDETPSVPTESNLEHPVEVCTLKRKTAQSTSNNQQTISNKRQRLTTIETIFGIVDNDDGNVDVSTCPLLFPVFKLENENYICILYNGAVFFRVNKLLSRSWWICRGGAPHFPACNVRLCVTAVTPAKDDDDNVDRDIQPFDELRLTKISGVHTHPVGRFQNNLYSLCDSVKTNPIFRENDPIPMDDIENDNRSRCWDNSMMILPEVSKHLTTTTTTDDHHDGTVDGGAITNVGPCPNELLLLEDSKGYARLLYRGDIYRKRNNSGNNNNSLVWICLMCKRGSVKTTADCGQLVTIFQKHRKHLQYCFPYDLFRFQHLAGGGGGQDDEEPIFRKGDLISYEGHDSSRCSRCCMNNNGDDDSTALSLSTDGVPPVPGSNVDLSQLTEPSTLNIAPTVSESSLEMSQSIEPTTLGEAPSIPESSLEMSQSIEPATLNEAPPVPESSLEMSQSIKPAILDEAPPVSDLRVDLFQLFELSTLNESPTVSGSNVDLSQSIEPSTLNESPTVSGSNVDLSQSIEPSTLNEAPTVPGSNVDLFQLTEPSTLNEAPTVLDLSLKMSQLIEPATLNEAPPVSDSNIDLSQLFELSTLDKTPSVPKSNVDLPQSIKPATLNEAQPVSDLSVDLSQLFELSTLDETPPVPKSNVDLLQLIKPANLNEAPPVSDLSVDLSQSIKPTTLDEAPPVSDLSVNLSQLFELSTLDEARPVPESNVDLSQSNKPTTLDEAPTVSDLSVDLSQLFELSTLDETPPVPKSNIDLSQLFELSTLEETPPVPKSNFDLSQLFELSATSVPESNLEPPAESTIGQSNVDQTSPTTYTESSEFQPPESSTDEMKSNVELCQPSETNETSPEVLSNNKPSSCLSTLQSLFPDLELNSQSLTISELTTVFGLYRRYKQNEPITLESDSTHELMDINPGTTARHQEKDEPPPPLILDPPRKDVYREAIPMSSISERELFRLASVKIDNNNSNQDDQDEDQSPEQRLYFNAKEQIRLNTDQQRLNDERIWYNQRQTILNKEWEKKDLLKRLTKKINQKLID